MKAQKAKSKRERTERATGELKPTDAAPQREVPAPEAFLEEANKEPKRLLLLDHIRTIRTLRNEKKFTFRAIAEWLNERGFETDHSAVYRVYLASIPEQDRDPSENWDDAALEEQ
jgi:hypothetical protein